MKNMKNMKSLKESDRLQAAGQKLKIEKPSCTSCASW
jgi:hypothetical protein